MYILIIKGVSVQNINEIYEKFLLDYSIVVRYMYMLDAGQWIMVRILASEVTVSLFCYMYICEVLNFDHTVILIVGVIFSL